MAAKCKKDALSVLETKDGADYWNGVKSSAPDAVRYHSIPPRALPLDAVCVDIRAAYPTTLANLGIISKAAHAGLMGLPKPARLKATGMMGTTKYRERLEHGRVTLATRETERTAGAFFAACHYVGSVMWELANELDEDFFLFWVDGIFIRRGREKLASEFLQSCGYDVSVEPVGGIRRSPSGKYLFYTKGGKTTYLCIPQRIELDTKELAAEMADAKNNYHE